MKLNSEFSSGIDPKKNLLLLLKLIVKITYENEEFIKKSTFIC